MYITIRKKITDILKEYTSKDDVQVIDGGEHADLASTLPFALQKRENRLLPR